MRLANRANVSRAIMEPSPSLSDAEFRAAHADAKVRRAGAYAAAVFLGGLFGLAIALFVIRQFGPGPIPEFSSDEFHTVRARWSQAAVTDYDLEVVVRGRETATYVVQVRDGAVRLASRNGQPLKQQRTWGTWSVQGMFETIERDLGTVDLQRQGKSEPGAPQLLLRGSFDGEFGFPRRYQRTEVRKFAANQEVSWEVTKFRPRTSPAQ